MKLPALTDCLVTGYNCRRDYKLITVILLKQYNSVTGTEVQPEICLPSAKVSVSSV